MQALDLVGYLVSYAIVKFIVETRSWCYIEVTVDYLDIVRGHSTGPVNTTAAN